IHSMFAYAAPQHPEHADDIARVLAVPGKRFRTTIVTHLAEEEITDLLKAPDPGTWTGRRDHALMLVAVTTGLRASELAGLTRADTHLGDGPHLECHGKGRKDRVTPLLRDTVAVLAAWLEENPGGPGSPLFPTRRGTPMSHSPHGRPARPLPAARRHHRLPRPPLIIPARSTETALHRAGTDDRRDNRVTGIRS